MATNNYDPDPSSKDVYDRTVGYVTHNIGSEPLGIRAPSVAGGVSAFTGGTTIRTVEHCLDLALERGDLAAYIDWSGRPRYLPPDGDVIASVIETDDLELAAETQAGVLRACIGEENMRDDPDTERIKLLAAEIARLEGDDGH